MAGPGMIGGGRMTRAERTGDRRQFRETDISKGTLLKRLWKYLGRNRLLLVLAILLSATSSALALYGPKLSGKAINALDIGENFGTVDFETIFYCVAWMVVIYVLSAVLSYLLHVVMQNLSKRVTQQPKVLG